MERIVQTDNKKRNMIALAVLILVILIGGILLYFYIQYKEARLSTDNAYVHGKIHIIAAKIPGTVKRIHVDDNQHVKKNDLLFEIDPVDYDVRLKQASSRLNAEKIKIYEFDAKIEESIKRISEANASLQSAKANLDLHNATLKQAENDLKRAENLFHKGVISQERFEKILTAYAISLAQKKSSEELMKQAEASLEAQKASLKQLEASKSAQVFSVSEKQAFLMAEELNYSYTKIYSPSDGYITKKSVEMGNQIQAGQPLAAVVSLGDVWIVANYKETQIKKIKPGQKVKIKVDSYPEIVLNGKVDSIMAGAGSTFSLFPPENATGNYVKVVQRIPVKIVLEKNTDINNILLVGMSVVPTVIVE